MASDRELVERWRDGDRDAGEALFERYYPRIVAFFRNKTRDDSVDLTQKTFLACFEAVSRLRDTGRFRSFLFAIACNQLRKHARTAARDREVIDFTSVSAHDLDPSPSRVAARREEQRLVLEGLRRIPLEYQIVLELHYWEDMSTSEVAETAGIPLGTAKARIRRGRELLAAAIERLRESPELVAMTLRGLESWARTLRERAHAGEA